MCFLRSTNLKCFNTEGADICWSPWNTSQPSTRWTTIMVIPTLNEWERETNLGGLALLWFALCWAYLNGIQILNGWLDWCDDVECVFSFPSVVWVTFRWWWIPPHTSALYWARQRVESSQPVFIPSPSLSASWRWLPRCPGSSVVALVFLTVPCTHGIQLLSDVQRQSGVRVCSI